MELIQVPLSWVPVALQRTGTEGPKIEPPTPESTTTEKIAAHLETVPHPAVLWVLTRIPGSNRRHKGGGMVHFGVNRTSANRTAEIVDITDLPTLISPSNGAISFGSPISEQLKQEIGFHHSSKIEWMDRVVCKALVVVPNTSPYYSSKAHTAKVCIAHKPTWEMTSQYTKNS